jgi:hypothetical protein
VTPCERPGSLRRRRERPFIRAASLIVQRAIRRGVLPKPSTLACTDCGDPASVYDHRFYSSPLLVQPVCVSCNYKRGPSLDCELLMAEVAHPS